MNSKTIISITEARKRIFDIAEEVQKPNKIYTLTSDGKPKAVIMSAEEYDSLMEDLEILSNPETMENIRKAEEEYKNGECLSWEETKKLLGWDKLPASLVMDKSNRRYGAKFKSRKKK
ncbi:MAG: type II toxin-antitoxin system Phd/YefM family antitoxin [Candidatus Azambacteria bacterium]|nr:type II toxin-antitoxin system Phd/YefM family antitoxin [Candidatus Azambacteria bacterium]